MRSQIASKSPFLAQLIIVVISMPFMEIIRTVNSSNSNENKCAPYCDADETYQKGFDCSPQHMYCCGNQTSRWCCKTPDIDFNNNDVCNCVTYSCLYNSWAAVFAVVFVVIVVLVSTYCCCQFLFKRCPCQRDSSQPSSVVRTHRHRRTAPGAELEAAVTEAGGSGAGLSSATASPGGGVWYYGPSHPFAFKPPDYDTVCRDLPKYEDVVAEPTAAGVGTQEAPPGYSNAGYTPGNEEVEMAAGGSDSAVINIIHVREGSSSFEPPCTTPPPTPPIYPLTDDFA